LNYYKHHLGDYAAATRHLSLLEHGVYRCLIDLYYINEAPLPLELRAVHRLVCARSKEEREAVETILEEFFVKSDDGWRNTRCDEEISAAQVKAEKNRELGKRGGRPRKTETETVSENNPNGFQQETETVSENNPSHKPIANSHVNPTVVERAGNSTSVARAQISPGEISPSAQVCLGLKSMGYSDTNPHDFELSALLQEGMTPDEILAVGSEFKGQGKRFRYLLKTAEGRRRDAANTKPLPNQMRSSTGKSITTGDDRAYASAVLTGKVPATTTIEEFIDRRRSPDIGTSILIEGESKHVA